MEHFNSGLYDEDDKSEKSIGTLTSWQMLAENVSSDEQDAEHEGNSFDDERSECSVHTGLHLSNLRSPSFFQPSLNQEEAKRQLVTPKQHHLLYREYRILNEIGSGAFGRVCLARRLADAKEVVVKEIKTSQLSGKIKATTMDEVQVLASLNHPNIVKFHECFMDDSYINIVMEYCNAGDLAKLLKSQKKHLLPEHHIMFLFVQICLALNCTHSAGVLHRDLKTGNCMLMKPSAAANTASTKSDYSAMPVLKLGDFGVAKVTGVDASVSSTVVGTPQYMTPEMIDNKPYGRKSDVWALGCILYEMCTLKKAFEADRIPVIFQKIALGQYDPLPPAFSQDMRDLVGKLLSRGAADRPAMQQVLTMPFVRRHLLLYLEWAKNVPEAQIQALLSGLGEVWLKAAGVKPSSFLATPGLSRASSTVLSVCSPSGLTAAPASTPPAAKPSMLSPMSRASSSSSNAGLAPPSLRGPAPASVPTAAPASAPSGKGDSLSHQSSERAKALFSSLPSTAALHGRQVQQQPATAGALHGDMTSTGTHPSPLVTSSSSINSCSSAPPDLHNSRHNCVAPNHATQPSPASRQTAGAFMVANQAPAMSANSVAAYCSNAASEVAALRSNSTSRVPIPKVLLGVGLTEDLSIAPRASSCYSLARPEDAKTADPAAVPNKAVPSTTVCTGEADISRRSTTSSIASSKPGHTACGGSASLELWGNQLQPPAPLSTPTSCVTADCTSAAAAAATIAATSDLATSFAAVQKGLIQQQHLLETETSPGRVSSVGAHAVVSVVPPGKDNTKIELAQLQELETQILQYLAKVQQSASLELAEPLAAAAAAVTAKHASLITALSSHHQLTSSTSSPSTRHTFLPAAAVTAPASSAQVAEATASLPTVQVTRSSRSFTEQLASGTVSRRSTKEVLSRAATTGNLSLMSLGVSPGESFEQWLPGDTSLLQRLQQADSRTNTPSPLSTGPQLVQPAGDQDPPPLTTQEDYTGACCTCSNLPTPRETTSNRVNGTQLDVQTRMLSAAPQQQPMSGSQPTIDAEQPKLPQLQAVTSEDDCSSSPLCKAAVDAAVALHPAAATQPWRCTAQLPAAAAARTSLSASRSGRGMGHSSLSLAGISTVTDTAQPGRTFVLIDEADDTYSIDPTADRNSSSAELIASCSDNQLLEETAIVKEQKEVLRLLKAFTARVMSSVNHQDQQSLTRSATDLSISTASTTVSARHVVDGLTCRSGNNGNGTLVATRWGPHCV